MLTRFKTFVATGLATAGRLYAGDLNGIQDAVAAQSDYTQRVDALTYGIGESALALTRYGAGEARLTGAMRLDGILRALGGLWGAQFTTTSRDALPAGSGLTPYGLIIFNTTTNRYEWNKGNDTTRNWQPLSGITVQKNGASPVSEGGVNFIEGAGISLTIVDNPGSGYVDVTIAAPPAGVAGTVPIGGGVDYYGASDPLNYLICDGRSLLRTGTYAGLFAVIGVVFGSVDGTHFNIPDTRGRVTVGVNTKVPLGANEGISPANTRHVSHYHPLSTDMDSPSQAQNIDSGVHIPYGHSIPGAYVGLTTDGDPSNQSTPAYLGTNKAIRYQ